MNSRLRELQKVFIDLGVTRIVPGFYDDPAFIEAEQQLPELLDFYGEYCVLAAEEENRSETEERVVRLVSFLSPLLAEEGRNGRCLPTTLLVQRFLDAEGVWNFPQKGGVVVSFPSKSVLPPKVFEPTDVREGTYGHAWNVAPPFIIDLTIARQFYSSAEKRYISGNLLVSEVAAAPESAFSEFPSDQIQSLFPPFTVALAQCSISYYPYGTGGPLERFAEMKEPVLDGLTPFNLHQRFAHWKAEQPV
ncbi:MAG: hypothetical protein WA324_10375 [Bryobacteraceae bacterium]